MTWKFGSHMSVAGGLHLAITAAHNLGMNACQVFTKNANQWKCKPLEAESIQQFRSACDAISMTDVCSHASYLINMATPNDELWEKSIDAMIIELERADACGLAGVVVHPGAFVESDETAGIARIKSAIERVLEKTEALKTKFLLENTAGQGSTLGWNIGQLAAMIKPFRREKRLGVCIDTCHAHAAGYDMSHPEGLTRLADELVDNQLEKRIDLIHLNDSIKGCGARVDRHEHIGLGTIGLAGFERFLHHPLFQDRPMVLETAKGLNDSGDDWDAVNMRELFKLTGRTYNMPTKEMGTATVLSKATKSKAKRSSNS